MCTCTCIVNKLNLITKSHDGGRYRLHSSAEEVNVTQAKKKKTESRHVLPLPLGSFMSDLALMAFWKALSPLVSILPLSCWVSFTCLYLQSRQTHSESEWSTYRTGQTSLCRELVNFPKSSFHLVMTKCPQFINMRMPGDERNEGVEPLCQSPHTSPTLYATQS